MMAAGSIAYAQPALAEGMMLMCRLDGGVEFFVKFDQLESELEIINYPCPIVFWKFGELMITMSCGNEQFEINRYSGTMIA